MAPDQNSSLGMILRRGRAILERHPQRRRNRMKTLGFALLAFAMAAPGARAQERWDLASAWPAGNFHVQNAMKFAEAVKKSTNGEVNITVHPGGSLGLKGPEMLVAVRDGQVAMADIQMNQQV